MYSLENNSEKYFVFFYVHDNLAGQLNNINYLMWILFFHVFNFKRVFNAYRWEIDENYGYGWRIFGPIFGIENLLSFFKKLYNRCLHWSFLKIVLQKNNLSSNFSFNVIGQR